MLLTRLDCGTPQAPIAVNERFSDTFSYGDLKIQFVYSCYLVKHGDQYLLWDTGHSMTAPNVAPKVSIVDQLDKIGVKPEQITYVGSSHYHADHTGQVASFPKATLLIGLGGWNAITATKRDVAIDQMVATVEGAMSHAIDWWGSLPQPMKRLTRFATNLVQQSIPSNS